MQYQRFSYAVVYGLILWGCSALPAFTQEPPAGPSTQSAEQRIRAALARPITVDYQETPLKDMAADLQKKLNVSIHLDQRALNELALEPEQPITFSAVEISANSVLRLILHELGLTWVVKHETLLITSHQEAESSDYLVHKMYDVSDLVRRSSGPASEDLDFLVEAITSTVRPAIWDEYGGSSTLRPIALPGIRALAVKTTEQVHEELGDWLAALRALRHNPAPTPQAGTDYQPPRPAAVNLPEGVKKIYRALDQTVSLECQFARLSEIVKELSTMTGVPIILSTNQELLVRKGPNPEADVPLEKVSLESALDLLTKNHELSWIIEDGKIQIVPKQRADQTLVTLTYDVFDLVPLHDRHGLMLPDFEAFNDVITETIDPPSWEVVGGPGSVSTLDCDNLRAIVVRQIWPVHRQIEKYLYDLRRQRGPLTAEMLEDLSQDPAASYLRSLAWFGAAVGLTLLGGAVWLRLQLKRDRKAGANSPRNGHRGSLDEKMMP
ncbi:MAG: hypothetical protein JXB10_08980 [Pirellulales bacterium]|nr:hypothetical protein [Pirellulales bacterium]